MNTNMTGFRGFSKILILCVLDCPCASDDSSLNIGSVDRTFSAQAVPIVPS